MTKKLPRGDISDEGRQYAEEHGLSLDKVRGLTGGDVAGLEVVEDNTAVVLAALPVAIAKGLEKVGQVAEGYAKRICPVDTGRLRNSITHAVDGSQSVVIGTNVEYAEPVEARSPYLFPAAQQHGSEYRDIIKGALESA